MTAPYQAHGYATQVRIAAESVYGTDPDNGTLIPFISCGVAESAPLVTSEVLGGTRNPRAPYKGLCDAGGDLVVPLDMTSLAVLLPYVLGSGLKTGAEVGSFTMGKGFNDLGKEWRYTGCKVSRLAMQFEVGGREARATLSIIGDGGVECAAFTPGTEPATVMLFDTMMVLSEGGTALPNGSKLTLDIDLGLDPANPNCRPFFGTADPRAGSGRRSGIPQGRAAVTGTLSGLFRDTTLWDKANAETASSLLIALARPGNDQGSLTLSLPYIKYALRSPAITGPAGILLDLDYTAYCGTGANDYALSATLNQPGT